MSINKFLKRIGAYTISDEAIDLYDWLHSLPRGERDVVDAIIYRGEGIIEAARRLGRERNDVLRLYQKAIDRLPDHGDYDFPDADELSADFDRGAVADGPA